MAQIETISPEEVKWLAPKYGSTPEGTAVYEKLTRISYKVARRFGKTIEDATDISQETALAIIKRGGYQDYDEERAKFNTLLGKIIKRKVIDQNRKKQVQNTEINHNTKFLNKRKIQTYTPPTFTEPGTLLRKVMLALAPGGRVDVLMLRHQHDKTIEQISDILDVPTGTVKTTLTRFRERVRDYYRDDETGLYVPEDLN